MRVVYSYYVHGAACMHGSIDKLHPHGLAMGWINLGVRSNRVWNSKLAVNPSQGHKD